MQADLTDNKQVVVSANTQDKTPAKNTPPFEVASEIQELVTVELAGGNLADAAKFFWQVDNAENRQDLSDLFMNSNGDEGSSSELATRSLLRKQKDRFFEKSADHFHRQYGSYGYFGNLRDSVLYATVNYMVTDLNDEEKAVDLSGLISAAMRVIAKRESIHRILKDYKESTSRVLPTLAMLVLVFIIGIGVIILSQPSDQGDIVAVTALAVSGTVCAAYAASVLKYLRALKERLPAEESALVAATEALKQELTSLAGEALVEKKNSVQQPLKQESSLQMVKAVAVTATEAKKEEAVAVAPVRAQPQQSQSQFTNPGVLARAFGALDTLFHRLPQVVTAVPAEEASESSKETPVALTSS